MAVIGKRQMPYPYLNMVGVSIDIDMGSLSGSYHRAIRTTLPVTGVGLWDGMTNGLGMDCWSDSFWIFKNSGAGVCAFDYDAPYSDWARETVEKGGLAGYIDACHGFGDLNPVNGATSPGGFAGITQEHKDKAEAWWNSGNRKRGSLFQAWYDHNPYKNQYQRTGFGYYHNTNQYGDFGLGAGRFEDYGSDPTSSDSYVTDVAVASDRCRFVWHREYANATTQEDWDRAYILDGSPIGFYMEDTVYDKYRTTLTVPPSQFLTPVTLDDGQKVWGFERWTSADAATSGQKFSRECAIYLPYGSSRVAQLDTEVGYFLHYSHYEGFPSGGIGATWLRKAWENWQAGITLPSRQSFMLNYALAWRNAEYDEVRLDDGSTAIDITHFADECFGDFVPSVEDCRGLTFYVDDAATGYKIAIAGHLIDESQIERNPADSTGQESISVKWHTTDTSTDYYAQTLAQVEAVFDVAPDPTEYLAAEAFEYPLEFPLWDSVAEPSTSLPAGSDGGVGADTGQTSTGVPIGAGADSGFAQDTCRPSGVYPLVGQPMSVVSTYTNTKTGITYAHRFRIDPPELVPLTDDFTFYIDGVERVLAPQDEYDASTGEVRLYYETANVGDFLPVATQAFTCDATNVHTGLGVGVPTGTGLDAGAGSESGELELVLLFELWNEVLPGEHVGINTDEGVGSDTGQLTVGVPLYNPVYVTGVPIGNGHDGGLGSEAGSIDSTVGDGIDTGIGRDGPIQFTAIWKGVPVTAAQYGSIPITEWTLG